MRGRLFLPATLLLGLLGTTALLIGPALAGRKVLLDLAILGRPGVYLPVEPGRPLPLPHDSVLSDPVLQFEPFRVYAAEAVRSGRVPLWSSLNYGGAPFLAANITAVFSPYRLLDYLWPAPAAIAWGQLLKTLVAGLGAYLYFRRAVGASPAAAVVGGWCFPWNGFLTLWSSHPQSAVASWLPWALLAADATARGRNRFAPIGLALSTAAALLSGHSATAVHVLIGAGLQGVFSSIDAHRGAGVRVVARAALRTTAGFALGILLSAPQTLPTLDYMRESRRMHHRAAGTVETPPAGWSALPQVALPYFHGATFTGAVYVGRGNRHESAAMAYPGLLLALVAAPLAAMSGRRSWILFGGGLVVLGLAQVLDLPLLAAGLQEWRMRAVRNNRLALLAAFGLLLLAVLGLTALESSRRPSRRLTALAAIPILLLALGSAHRAVVPPATLERALGRVPPPLVADARAWFVFVSWWGVALGVIALGCLAALHRRAPSPSSAWMLGTISLAELALSAATVFPLSDPALYYPRLPILNALAAAPPGRACGALCLPPDLNIVYGLRDVRGYDGADPDRMVELLLRLDRAGGALSPRYAPVLTLVPRVPSPLADLLGLRYVLHRGVPPPGARPVLAGTDYFVVENPSALPRAWVPSRIEVVADPDERLRRLVDPAFDPREVAFAESAAGLPRPGGSGAARLVRDDEEHVTLQVDMKTEGVVVLADRWDANWRAFVDGRERAILRVNHALRGVVVPPGRWTVDLRYRPASFHFGVLAMLAGLASAGSWALFARRPSGGEGSHTDARSAVECRAPG